MSKQKTITVAKNVGANCVRPHFEEMTKKQNGITLIALVITIIVMLILVGVSVTVALNGGLFSTAKQATSDTEIERDKELALSDGRVKVDGIWYDSVEDYINKKPSENQSESSTEGEEPTENTILQEIELEGENFYVIAESDETVTLLAKYNLNTEGTAQVNAAYSETACAFSSTNYWSSETEYPLNLNEYTTPEGATSVITTAKTYGEAKGGTGRLLTKDEAETLVTNYEGIIYGTSIEATDGYLNYWLGSADYVSTVWCVVGGGSSITCSDFGYVYVYGGYGVRPVVEISKSSIS